MSFLGYGTLRTPDSSFYITDDILSTTVNSINSTILSTIETYSLYPAISPLNLANNPILSTNAIVLDGVTITATYDEILINGVPIATSTALASLSSISDWAYYE